MKKDEIERKKAAVVAEHGPWTAHNVHLGEGVYTRSTPTGLGGDERRMKRLVQLTADLSGKDFADLRVLDLACLEGLFAIELARQGARSVGIEGRETNLAKARLVKDVLGLERLELHVDDVRNLSREKYGEFDVVLCSGILYHLDAPDVFRFVERIAEVTAKVAIFDTQIALFDHERRAWAGETYFGKSVPEHDPNASTEQKKKALWASLDNPKSFWLTRASLDNLLVRSGFTSVLECQAPAIPEFSRDRVTIAAVKGRKLAFHSAPLANELRDFVPETPVLDVHPHQRVGPLAKLRKRISAKLPRRVDKILREL